MKYRKKPVVIEAIQWNGTNTSTILSWINDPKSREQEGHLVIQTLEGCLFVSKDDWIIKGVKGEFYPCKPNIFQATYETVA